jgi:Flp pilus assembly pilin Flp
VTNLIGRFIRESDGQDIIEYALLGAFVSIVAWLVIKDIGVQVKDIYTDVQTTAADAAAAN